MKVSIASPNNYIYIGIDPDSVKSGVTIYHKVTKHIDMRLMMFLDLYDFLKDFEHMPYTTVYLEAGWLNKPANFRKKIKKNGIWVDMPISVQNTISAKVGRNFETGYKIIEILDRFNYEYIEVKPTKSKLTPSDFARITGIKEKNQEKIDSAMLVYGR